VQLVHAVLDGCKVHQQLRTDEPQQLADLAVAKDAAYCLEGTRAVGAAAVAAATEGGRCKLGADTALAEGQRLVLLLLVLVLLCCLLGL
jgi:hypothetical protein